ncbi:hypothetical protein BGZ96_003218 [Linnemannia gamsii]|uniref:Galactose oxidase n=1 Tax=Linnemannia gamsii TaxID=64522 RepID=A0ABQ7K7Z4_9FUNG|nr:hypothetical protein BGZ96_003218 [Linnemannia gamsii]
MRSLSLTLLVTTTILSTFASAQVPAGVTCMAYASLDEKTFYIQGGTGFQNNTRYQASSFIALDLTVTTWSTASPPWLSPPILDSVAPTSSCHSMAVAGDRGNLFVWDPYQKGPWWTYNIVLKYWSNYTIPLNITQQPGIRNGVDMNTGNVFIPAGSDNGSEMIMNTPGLSAVPVTVIPISIMPVPVVQESFVWSTYRNTFLHYGGRSMDGKTANPRLNEFSSTIGWAPVTTSGTSPGDVSGHCMVQAYGGTKMIVFGGAGLDGIAKGDIYFLDVPSHVWAVGRAADATQARTNMACSVSGDSFIAWGGESASGIKDATPIVFDMKNNVWTTQFNRVITATATSGPYFTSAPFIPGTPPPPSSTSNNPTTSPQSSSKANIGLIGGGIAGLVVVTAAVVGFIFYRRRCKQARTSDDKDGNDTIRLSPREPRKPEGSGDFKSEHLGRTSYSPPLQPRPRFNNDNSYNSNYSNGGSNNDGTDHYAAMTQSYHPTMPASIGPYAAMRSPESGIAHVPTNPYKTEWTENDSEGYDQSSKSSPPRSLHEFSDNSNHHGVHSSSGISSNQYKAPLGLRNPHTPPGAGETGWTTQSRDLRLRGPQGQQQHQQTPVLPVHPDHQSQGHSRYVVVDQIHSQYQDRSRELTRMMDNIRAEQEELERTRLEHELQMQAQREYSQPHYQSPPPPPK